MRTATLTGGSAGAGGCVGVEGSVGSWGGVEETPFGGYNEDGVAEFTAGALLASAEMPFATEGDGDNPEGGSLGESVGVGLELENKLNGGHPKRTTKKTSAVPKPQDGGVETYLSAPPNSLRSSGTSDPSVENSAEADATDGGP